MLIHITDRKSKLAAMDELGNVPMDGTQVLEIREYSKKRKDAQNRLAFMWYTDIDKQTKQGYDYERFRLKLERGIPILRRDDAEFNAVYNKTLLPLSYEDKKALMQWFPVTSLMNTKQFAEYLDLIDKECISEGIQLRYPDDLINEAMMR